MELFSFYFMEALTIWIKSCLSDAPPTKEPSMSSHIARFLQLAAVTEPPYKILVLLATLLDTFFSNHFLQAAWTSWACSGVAVLPVPAVIESQLEGK